MPDCVRTRAGPSWLYPLATSREVYQTARQSGLGGAMPQGGTPPLVPMWPQPGIREGNQNPFPFFPFDPHWGDDLPMLEFECFCALLRLAWVSPRPCYLPSEPEVLERMLESCRLRGGAPISNRVLSYFTLHPRTKLLYFPPQLRALQRLVSGENMYALLWDDPKTSRGV